MTDVPSSDRRVPSLEWNGSVQLQMPTAFEVGSDVHVRLVWSEPVQPAECIISLRDRRATIVWSEKVVAGKSEIEFHLPATASLGTYTVDVSLDNWTLAEENIEVLGSGELAGCETFGNAVALRGRASSASSWEDAVRFDEQAAEAYERAETEHLAAISFLDAAETALANGATDRARAAVVRAANLAAKIDNMSVLASALLRLGQIEVKLDRRETAIATLDRARTIAEVANVDWVAVKSSILQWRCSLGLDQTRRWLYYRNLIPILTCAVTPAARKEALAGIRELRPYLILESATPVKMRPRNWSGICDFRSRHLSQYADVLRAAEIIVPWDSSAELFCSALLKRTLASLAKWLVDFSLDVVLTVEANRGEEGESFKVTIRDPKTTLKVGDATRAWSQSEDFSFLNEFSMLAGGTIRTSPAATQTLVEFTLPNSL